jgi:hypothetical protein
MNNFFINKGQQFSEANLQGSRNSIEIREGDVSLSSLH